MKTLKILIFVFTINFLPAAAYAQFELSIGELYEEIQTSFQENRDPNVALTKLSYIARRCLGAIAQLPEEANSELVIVLSRLSAIKALDNEEQSSEEEYIKSLSRDDFLLLKFVRSKAIAAHLQTRGENQFDDADVKIAEIYEELYSDTYATTGRYFNEEISRNLAMCFI